MHVRSGTCTASRQTYDNSLSELVWSDLPRSTSRPKVASSLAPSPFLTRLFRLTDIKRTHRSPLFDSAIVR